MYGSVDPEKRWLDYFVFSNSVHSAAMPHDDHLTGSSPKQNQLGVALGKCAIIGCGVKAKITHESKRRWEANDIARSVLPSCISCNAHSCAATNTRPRLMVTRPAFQILRPVVGACDRLIAAHELFWRNSAMITKWIYPRDTKREHSLKWVWGRDSSKKQETNGVSELN